MASTLVPREAEERAVADFFARAHVGVAGLVIEGEPGIGKTTLWLDGLATAADQGFQVLAARGAPAEVTLTYAALADLLSGVDPALLAELPPLQQVAIDRVLMRGDDGPATDEHVAAAAFSSVIERLAADAPVIVAIDDVQWLDTASRAVVGFGLRRLRGRIGVLVTRRTGEGDHLGGSSWLRLPHPDALVRMRMGPLTLGGVHALISQRLGTTLPRPTVVRIHEISGGNPFYALELARTISEGESAADLVLPDSLSALVRARVGDLDDEIAAALLAAACTPAATIALVARAIDTTEQLGIRSRSQLHAPPEPRRWAGQARLIPSAGRPRLSSC